MSSRNQSAETGRVLGVSEKMNVDSKLVEQNNDLSQVIVKAMAEVKSLPASKLFQLPQSEQPIIQSQKESIEQAIGEEKFIMADSDFSAENGVVMDCQDDRLIFAKRPDRPWPIASITKLFTAYTFLDYNPGWETDYKIKIEDRREGGRIYLFTGDVVTVKDLFYTSLVGSDNTATAALVQATGLDEAAFVAKVNAKIKELGLKNTRIVDPIGLNDGNLSTAREVALFAKIALARQEVSRASLTKTYEFSTKQGRKKVINSTDELLNSSLGEGISILGGKTGYVNSAGYCLVNQFKDKRGQSIVTVILGADSDSGRFSLTRKLVDAYYKSRP
jgi:D-alanyl-D-alanine carboxypeptidase